MEEINYFSLLQSLSIAHFNEGVENEHLKYYQEALESYEKSKAYAQEVSEGSGGGNDAMLINALKSIAEVRVKHQNTSQSRSIRVSKRENLDTMKHFKDPKHLKNIDQIQKERLGNMMASLMMKANRDNNDERSI